MCLCAVWQLVLLKSDYSRIHVITKKTNYVYGRNRKTRFSHTSYRGAPNIFRRNMAVQLVKCPTWLHTDKAIHHTRGRTPGMRVTVRGTYRAELRLHTICYFSSFQL
jgi:hypothetical protein